MTLPKHGDIILNSWAKQEDNGTLLFWVELSFKGYEDAKIFCASIFIFCLERTVTEQLDENNFRHYYGIFFKSAIMKLFDHSYVQSFFATITKHLIYHNCWRFYGHGSPYELIFSWVDIFKQQSAKKPGKLSFKQSSKPALRRTLHQDISLIPARFLFSQINLVYNFILCFSDNFRHNLFTCLLFDVLCILGLIQSIHVFL